MSVRKERQANFSAVRYRKEQTTVVVRSSLVIVSIAWSHKRMRGPTRCACIHRLYLQSPKRAWAPAGGGRYKY